MECRLAYSREWAIRMTHEQAMHAASCFLTLTYDDEHLPPYGQLVKRDLQLFFKRLRKSVGPFRYVACGEYGELRRRPHFHVALFGLDFRADRLLRGQGIQGDELFESATLASVWTQGQHMIGALTFESAAYIARYITKRVSGPGVSPLPLACDRDTGELVMPNPEFLLCSRRPGIGDAWFRKYFRSDVFPHGRVITAQGTPAPVPRFYKEKLNFMDKALMRGVMDENLRPTLAKQRLEDSPARRAARTKYAEIRNQVFKRDVKG